MVHKSAESRNYKGTNTPISGRVSEIRSGSNSWHCQNPQLSRFSPKPLRAATTQQEPPRGRIEQAAKGREWALLQLLRGALIQRGRNQAARGPVTISAPPFGELPGETQILEKANQ